MPLVRQTAGTNKEHNAYKKTLRDDGAGHSVDEILGAIMIGSTVTALAAAILMPQAAILDVAQPEVVAKALQAAGYKAELKTADRQNPEIISATNGDSFVIRFYACTEAKDCGSFQFFNYLPKEPHFDESMANAWNSKKRFLKVAIDSDGDLSYFMDVSATGGMTAENFSDTVDWFTVVDADLRKFVAEHRGSDRVATPPPE